MILKIRGKLLFFISIISVKSLLYYFLMGYPQDAEYLQAI